ncbi:MAG: preprotein translocase subunit SecE [Myxococcales bacterium]|nr:preprotein translocase subunit SecE [Myxococcales bacterium]
MAAVGAVVIGVTLYRNDRIYDLANEVSSELKKVTWPTAKEIRSATTVVIVMTVISAVILGVFDLVWSNLTELVYG